MEAGAVVGGAWAAVEPVLAASVKRVGAVSAVEMKAEAVFAATAVADAGIA
jgi:hypothetical protein